MSSSPPSDSTPTRDRSISNGNFRARSTSAATSFQPSEISQEHKELLQQHMNELFSSIGDTLRAEMQLHFNELQFQEELNRVALQEYENVTSHTEQEFLNLQALRKEFESVIPFLQEIDEVESEVGEMQRAVRMLDKYTRDLEQQLKPYL